MFKDMNEQGNMYQIQLFNDTSLYKYKTCIPKKNDFSDWLRKLDK